MKNRYLVKRASILGGGCHILLQKKECIDFVELDKHVSVTKMCRALGKMQRKRF